MSNVQKIQNALPLVHIGVQLSEIRLDQLVRASFAERPSKYYLLGDTSAAVFRNVTNIPAFQRILVTDHQTLASDAGMQTLEAKGKLEHVSLVLLQGKQDKPHPSELVFPRIHRVVRPGKVKDVIDHLHKSVKKEAAYLIRQQMNALAEIALAKLSPRETEVLELMVQGCAISEISQSLSIAGPTVKIHKAKVFEKTGCKNLRQLILTFAPRYLNDESLFK